MRPMQFACAAALVTAGLLSTSFAAMAAPNAAMDRDTNVRRTSSPGSDIVNFVEEGEEVGRIRGYPGDEFFWYLLAELIAKLDTQDAR